MKYIVHPNIDNDRREAVYAWCTKQWGDYRENYNNTWKWYPKSNYDRGDNSGTFDIVFQDKRLVDLFIIAWGGYIAETEGVPEYKVTKTHFNKLFGVA